VVVDGGVPQEVLERQANEMEFKCVDQSIRPLSIGGFQDSKDVRQIPCPNGGVGWWEQTLRLNSVAVARRHCDFEEVYNGQHPSDTLRAILKVNCMILVEPLQQVLTSEDEFYQAASDRQFRFVYHRDIVRRDWLTSASDARRLRRVDLQAAVRRRVTALHRSALFSLAG